jgi:hypothetical protein
MSYAQRVAVLIALFAVAAIAVLFVAPIPQDPAYHLFADTRAWLGIPNFGDVASNLGFALVGALGLRSVLGARGRDLFDAPSESWPYLTFFAAIGLVSLGSAYYHASPDNAHLFWDRLPMTIAFMALLYAFLSDRIGGVAQRWAWLLPALVAAGFASLLYWDWTEAQGRGDLRLYAMVQFYPMVALPVICWLFPNARYTRGLYLVWIILWYAAAKIFEHFDAWILEALGGTISGHSLKHLASAVAAYMIWRMVENGRRGRG